MKKIFRALIVISFGFYSIYFFLPFIDVYFHSEEMLNLLAWNGYDSLLYFDEIVINFIYIAYFITSLGLYFFKYWARPIFLSLTIFSILLAFVSGTTVLTNIDFVLISMISLFDGAILTMLYLTSISKEFE